MRFPTFSALLGGLFLGAAALHASFLQSDESRDAVNRLLDADRAFSTAGAERPAIESISSMFAEGVIVPAGNRFADGRAAAIEAMRANPDNVSGRATWTPIRGGISTDGSTRLHIRLHDRPEIGRHNGSARVPRVLDAPAGWLAGIGVPATSTAGW